MFAHLQLHTQVLDELLERDKEIQKLTDTGEGSTFNRRNHYIVAAASKTF